MNRAERRPAQASRAAAQAQATRRRIILWSTLGLIAIAIIVVIALANRVPQSASTAPISAQLTIGQQAPEFTVSTTQGPFDLAAARGKPTLLEVFATWCPHCQRETAVLNRLYATYKDRIHFVAVSGSAQGADQGTETQADVINFANHFKVQYPIAFDGNLSVAQSYLQGGFPTLVLIGPTGKIESVTSGEVPESDLAAALKSAAAGGVPNPTMNFPAA